MSEREKIFEPDPVIEAYKRDVDRTLIRENLRLSVEERFEKLMRLQRAAEEMRKAGRKQNQAETDWGLSDCCHDSPRALRFKQCEGRRCARRTTKVKRSRSILNRRTCSSRDRK